MTQALPKTMKALAKLHAKEGLWMIEAPVPEIGPQDVLIRIHHTAICGTDVHIYNWDEWASKTVPLGLITGHEFSGEIVAIGQEVTRPLSVGQIVSGEGHVIDINSTAARAGRFHLDPNTKGVGVNRQGAFAQYLSLPAFNVVPLPNGIAPELGALLDPFGNAVHTALKGDLLGANVLVTGAGPIGIMAAAFARFGGARKVVLTDINPYRLKLAAQFDGVIGVNIMEQSLKEVMAQHGITEGFDSALEMSGAEPAIHQALEALRMGGTLNLLGLPSKTAQVDWGQVIMKALTINGVYGREMFETWRVMLGALEAGFDLGRIITHRFQADEFQQGFDIMRSGQSGKVLLHWS